MDLSLNDLALYLNAYLQRCAERLAPNSVHLLFSSYVYLARYFSTPL
jgi:hypothetical protein